MKTMGGVLIEYICYNCSKRTVNVGYKWKLRASLNTVQMMSFINNLSSLYLVIVTSIYDNLKKNPQHFIYM